MAGPYVPDPDDPKKLVPTPSTHPLYMEEPSTSHIPVFATDAEAQVAKPAKGTMTYSTQQTDGRIYIYDGSAWGYLDMTA
jgi:hypothetical protein